MPLGQGWLNAWVKVNSKHVVLTPAAKKEKAERELNQSQSSSKGGTRLGGATASVPSEIHTTTLAATKSHGAATVATEPTTDTTQDPEKQAIRRFNTRKLKRRIQRTVSASDLLRDKAKGTASTPEVSATDDRKSLNGDELEVSRSSKSEFETSRSSKSTTKNKTRTSVRKDKSVAAAHVAQHKAILIKEAQEPEGADDSSLRFVSGFFGADIERYGSGHAYVAPRTPLHLQQSQSSVASTGIDEHSIAKSVSMLDSASLPSRGTKSLPPHHAYRSNNRSSDSRSQGGGISLGFPNLFLGDNGQKQPCKHCKQLEDELLSTQEDLEYLRSMSLRKEYICRSCHSHGGEKNRDDASEVGTSDSSHTMNEVSTRQKKQIEQLTRERAYWQQDSHFKLQKFANLCKDLNEEAALRNEEALSLHQEVDVVRAERDGLISEVASLKATVELLERRAQEDAKSKGTISENQHTCLSGVEDDIRTRDAVINDLSTKLDQALETIMVEREQQRQRRQIIFPSHRPAPSADEEAELEMTKAALRETQLDLDALRREQDRERLESMIRIEKLERQLEAARSR